MHKYNLNKAYNTKTYRKHTIPKKRAKKSAMTQNDNDVNTMKWMRSISIWL